MLVAHFIKRDLTRPSTISTYDSRWVKVTMGRKGLVWLLKAWLLGRSRNLQRVAASRQLKVGPGQESCRGVVLGWLQVPYKE